MAIISLLIGILLPALLAADRLTERIGCASNQRQIGVAVTSYATDCGDYLPGPNTSGYYLRLPLITGDAVSEADAGDTPLEPMTADDWASPLFGDKVRAESRGKKWAKLLRSDVMHCPSNETRYGQVTNLSGAPASGTIPLNSYSMPFAMHAYQSQAHAIQAGKPAGFYLTGYAAAAVDLSKARNSFRIDDMGSPAGKALLLDGSNRWDEDKEYWVLNGKHDKSLVEGGPFMSHGPTLLSPRFTQSDSPYRDTYDSDSVEDFAYAGVYRHDKDTINVAHVDGHVEQLGIAESRDPFRWFPSRTVITQRYFLGDRSIPNGTVVP